MNEKEIIEGRIRTIGQYQPFCSLMRHGKIETRWIRYGKKPPFPLGKYLGYSTKKMASHVDLFNWCGPNLMGSIYETLRQDYTKDFHGFGIWTGNLIKVRLMTKQDEPLAFVEWQGIQEFEKDGETFLMQQWCLEFDNIESFKPFRFLHGKQGVGFLPDEYLPSLKQEINNQ